MAWHRAVNMDCGDSSPRICLLPFSCFVFAFTLECGDSSPLSPPGIHSRRITHMPDIQLDPNLLFRQQHPTSGRARPLLFAA
jgi:hypothetical protein